MPVKVKERRKFCTECKTTKSVADFQQKENGSFTAKCKECYYLEMDLITTKQVAKITGLGLRSIQYAYSGDNYKFKPKLPCYTVEKGKIYFNKRWIEIPKELSQSKVVFTKLVVKNWFKNIGK